MESESISINRVACHHAVAVGLIHNGAFRVRQCSIEDRGVIPLPLASPFRMSKSRHSKQSGAGASLSAYVGISHRHGATCCYFEEEHLRKEQLRGHSSIARFRCACTQHDVRVEFSIARISNVSLCRALVLLLSSSFRTVPPR
jgi:hypothetical protein